MDKLIELKRGPCYSEITRAALDHLISKDMSLIEKYNVHINGLGTSKPVEVKQKKISDFF